MLKRWNTSKQHEKPAMLSVSSHSQNPNYFTSQSCEKALYNVKPVQFQAKRKSSKRNQSQKAGFGEVNHQTVKNPMRQGSFLINVKAGLHSKCQG